MAMVKQHIVCLMYHKIQTADLGALPHDQYAIDATVFRRQMEILRDRATVISLEGLSEGTLADSKTGSTPPMVAITFDDGHCSSLWAAELLASLDLTATFYLTRDFCERRDTFLNAEQIRAMSSLGMTIGTHGCTHRHMKYLPSADLEEELACSRQWLEGILGHPVTHMSFPAGAGGRRERDLAASLGYRLVGDSVEKPNRLPLKGTQLHRIAIRRNFDERKFLQIVRGNPFRIMQMRIRSAALWAPKTFIEYRRMIVDGPLHRG